MYFPIEGWFVAFLITLAVEVPVVVLLARRAEPSLVRLALLALFANLATHPIVWYVISQLLLVGTTPYVVVAESWAVAAEAVFYAVTIRALTAQRAVAIAVVANAASFVAGRAIAAVWPELF
jgi:hypothetical protein